MLLHPISRPLLSAACLSLLAASAALAGTAVSAKTPADAGPAAAAPKDQSSYDRIWNLAALYESKTGFLNKLSLTGRYHGQFWSADSDTGHEYDWENRRIRAGLKGKFLQNFEFNVQADLNPEANPVYTGLTDAYLAWKPSDAFHLTIGKHPTDFTLEGSTSSNNILTFERSLAVNQVWPNPEYITGIMMNGEISHFLYQAGIYAADQQKEFTEFSGGAGYLLSVGYDFAEAAGLDEGVVKLDLFYNDGDAGNTALRPYETTESLNINLKKGPVGFAADVILAQGLEGASDFWGLVLMPSYDFSKKWQAVARYQFAHAEEADGLSAARRYEREAGGGKGDTYHAGYVGINHYLYGHKLKLMGGVEYAQLSGGSGHGYEGWTALAGVRVSW